MLPGNRQVTHLYPNGAVNPSVITITVDVYDEDAQPHLAAGTRSLIVNDVAPTVSLSGNESTLEGSLYTLTLGDVVDPSTTDAITAYVVNWGPTPLTRLALQKPPIPMPMALAATQSRWTW